MIYDLIIIGLGPAGLTASIYASRYGLKHLLIGLAPGGTASEAFRVENYPGHKSIPGADLMKIFFEQASSYQPEIVIQEVIFIGKKQKLFEIKTKDNKIFKTHSVILAMGVRHRPLGVPGEEFFVNKGISYCPTCDGPLFKNKIVAVAGGGDSALTSALYLAKIATKVYLINNLAKFTGQNTWIEKVKKEKKIIKILKRKIEEVRGKKFLEEIVLNRPYQNRKTLLVNGLFVKIGMTPAGENIIFGENIKIKRNKNNYIEVSSLMKTSVPGLFAAGDITGGAEKLRQIITSSAEGAIAAASAYRFLTKTER